MYAPTYTPLPAQSSPPANSRFGCYYCFGTLDPEDRQAEFRTFIKCSQCGAVYHTACWPQFKKCICCGSDQVQSVQISPPSSLKTVTKTGTPPVRASAIAYSIGRIGIVMPDLIYKQVLPAIHGYEIWILMALLSLLFWCSCLTISRVLLRSIFK